MTSYERWIAQFDTWSASDEIAWRRRLRALRRKPLISVIVPVYNPDLKFLEAAIHSVRSQVYDAWELCLADAASTDADVRPFLEETARSDTLGLTSFRERTGHIAACSNPALPPPPSSPSALLLSNRLFDLRSGPVRWVVVGGGARW